MSYDCYGDCGDYIKPGEECYQCVSCTKRYHVLCANYVVATEELALCNSCLAQPTVKMFWLDLLARKIENSELAEGFVTVSAPNTELLDAAENVTKVLQTMAEKTHEGEIQGIIDVLQEGNTITLDCHNKMIEGNNRVQESILKTLEVMNAHNKVIAEGMVTQNTVLGEIVEVQKKLVDVFEKLTIPTSGTDATSRITKLEQELLKMQEPFHHLDVHIKALLENVQKIVHEE